MKSFSSLLLLTSAAICAKLCHSMAMLPRESSSIRSARLCNSNVTSQLEKLRVEYDVPALGVSVGPHFKGAVVGTRKINTNVNATIHDIYHIGSNTKAMTATVIAILVEEGILSWKTSLGEVLTGYSILEPYRNVTIELLTSHRSGITDDAAGEATFLSSLYNFSAPLGRVKMAERTLSSISNSTQGIWAYANMNYVLAGLIVDITTGRTVEEIMYNKLFKPLSMNSAGWGATPERSNTSIDNPWGHIMTADGPQAVGEGEENKYRDLPPGISTAGLLHMTIQDLNKFLAVHLDGTQGKASKALNLTAKGFEKLHTAAPGPLPEETPGYGYTFGGFGRHDEALTPGEYILAHCGSNDRNFACVHIITATKTIFTSFTNIGPTAGDLVANELIGRLQNGTMVF